MLFELLFIQLLPQKRQSGENILSLTSFVPFKEGFASEQFEL